MPAAEGRSHTLGRQASEKPRGRKPWAGMGWRCRAGLWGFENGASGDVRMSRSSDEARGVSLRWRSTPLRWSACPWDVRSREMATAADRRRSAAEPPRDGRSRPTTSVAGKCRSSPFALFLNPADRPVMSEPQSACVVIGRRDTVRALRILRGQPHRGEDERADH
jgi:hypothetical protein